MDYEKKYKEALERARKCWGEYNELVGAYENKGVCEEIFPELRESEDEKIRKELKTLFLGWINGKSSPLLAEPCNRYIAWLEEQGEHKKFRDSIQVGDKVTKNEDGVLVNLSQMNRVAKKDKNQGEQKPVGKVEPKFKIGDWVVRNGKTLQISGIDTVLDGTFHYWFTKGTWLSSKKMKNAMLWTIQDAKEGDVLACPNDAGDRDVVFIFKNINSDEGWVFCFCASDANGCFCTNNDYVGNSNSTNISPATKEQRDLLFQKMKEAGYTFDFEKKELKKIEQNPAWSEEDETNLTNIIIMLKEGASLHFNKEDITKAVDWLKSLIPRSQWKPSKEQISVLSRSLKYINTISPNYCHVLKELLAQLNKLREE